MTNLLLNTPPTQEPISPYSFPDHNTTHRYTYIKKRYVYLCKTSVMTTKLTLSIDENTIKRANVASLSGLLKGRSAVNPDWKKIKSDHLKKKHGL